jgi:hypothetical protein
MTLAIAYHARVASVVNAAYTPDRFSPVSRLLIDPIGNPFNQHLHPTILNTTMSQTQLAIVVGSDITTYSLKSIDVPKPEADEVLVKIHAAAQNPADCERNTVKYRYLQALTGRFNREDDRRQVFERGFYTRLRLRWGRRGSWQQCEESQEGR